MRSSHSLEQRRPAFHHRSGRLRRRDRPHRRPPRSATVTAGTDLICYGLTSWEFRPLVEKNSAIAWKLLHALAKAVAGRRAEHASGERFTWFTIPCERLRCLALPIASAGRARSTLPQPNEGQLILNHVISSNATRQ